MHSAGIRNLPRTLAAYGVHCLTASGAVFALLAALELFAETPDARRVFLWLIAATVVDAIDGPLARLVNVKKYAAQIAGRTIDDLVDYLTYTFVPLLLVWRMGWLPEPIVPWVALVLVASLFGFANVGIKQEDAGFFLGFPSYWNVYAFYAGLWATQYSLVVPTVVLVALVILTFLPVRFLYPNLAPRRWRVPLLAGAAVWLALLLWMLPGYPDAPPWLMWLSLLYPIFYCALSLWLDWRTRAAAFERQLGNS